ncbi:killer toxin, Kp4 [Fusarium austroafricanum]|uniref:Killer toxin, Kp4 n=1 Tax=Fusarium austroafricanum TaxID=2364996 RepID=A0A8H4KDF4_9HYPO|nr:killer toxin, Kp4 [Fusarium austroafricanum]
MFKSALFALAATVGLSDALGINCRGSGLCVGNKGALGQLIAQVRAIDPNKTFRNGEHVSCVDINNIGNHPAICAFYQNIGDRSFSLSQTQTFLQQIVDHGCKLCGSVPTDPGNNVANGQLTVNVVINPTRRDAPQSPSGFEKRSNNPTRRDAPESPEGFEKRSDLPTKRDVSQSPKGFEKRSDKLLVKRLGINCRGSSSCGVGGIFHTPNGDLKGVRDAVASGEEGNFGNGDHIACIPYAFGQLCAFYQNIGSRTFTKEQSVAFLDQLRQHGCSKCGSIPTDPGNDVKNGQLTVNYVA